ncbi:TPA: hypothetical protein DEP96_00620 [Candidatus Uhrbacteria bacterium]|nr:hypothetical protein [Candidatus Uhrbacteria bacterium]
MTSLNSPHKTAESLPTVSLEHLNSQGHEKMCDTHKYSVCAYLAEALRHRECETYVELIETLYDEQWLPDVIDRTITFLSKNFPCIHKEGKIDSMAVAEVLRATQPGLLRGYDAQGDRDRWPSDAERVWRNVLLLHELYRQRELPAASLDEYLEKKVQLPADYEVLRRCIAPALGKNRVIDRGNLVLSAKQFYQVQIVPVVEPQRLMDVTREKLGFLIRTHGKSPVEKVQIELDYARVRLRSLRGELKKQTGDALQLVRAELVVAEAAEGEILRRRATLMAEVESQPVVTPPVVEPVTAAQVTATMKVTHAAELAMLAASVHRAAGLLLAGLAVRTTLPADVIVGWQLKKVVLALTSDDQAPSFVMEVINSLVGRGLTVLARKSSLLNSVFRWTEVDYGPGDQVAALKLTFVQRVAAKIINEEMSSLPGLRSTHNWIASNTEGIITDMDVERQLEKSAVERTSPVVIETPVETVAPAVVEAEVEVVTESVTAVTAAAVEETVEAVVAVAEVATVAAEEVLVELAPVASSVSEENNVPEEGVVMSENVNQVLVPVVRCSPVAAECHRVAGLLLERLKPHGWPDGILTSPILQKVVLLVRPGNRHPGVVVTNEMVARGLTPVFYRGGHQSVFQRDLATFDTTSATVRVQPRIVPDEEVQALAEALFADKVWWTDTVAYLRKWAPQVMEGIADEVTEPEPVVEPEAEDEPVVESKATAQVESAKAAQPVEAPVAEPEPEETPVAEPEQVSSPAEPQPEPGPEPEPEPVLVPAVVPVLSKAEQFQQLLPTMISMHRAKIESAQQAVVSRQQEVERLQEALRLATEELEEQEARTREIVMTSGVSLEHMEALLEK